MRVDVFIPYDSSNLAVTVTTGSQALTKGSCVRLSNNGTVPLFFAFGGAGVAATLNSVYLGPGASEVFGVTADPFASVGGIAPTYIAAITASGTATLNIATGEGA